MPTVKDVQEIVLRYGSEWRLDSIRQQFWLFIRVCAGDSYHLYYDHLFRNVFSSFYEVSSLRKCKILSNIYIFAKMIEISFLKLIPKGDVFITTVKSLI